MSTNCSRWRVEIRRLIESAGEPVIVGAICGLILSLNSTNSLLVYLYAVSGLNCILAYLTMTWFPASEHMPFPWVRAKYLCAIGWCVRKFWAI